MIRFRKMEIEDIDNIYNDPELRPLVTLPPRAERFAVVAEEKDMLIGGAAGYINSKYAFAEYIVITCKEQHDIFEDGLIRSLIHILESEGINYLFVREGEDCSVYGQIGFRGIKEWPKDSPIPRITDLSADELIWIDLNNFFAGRKYIGSCMNIL